jgi:hypothetical protein
MTQNLKSPADGPNKDYFEVLGFGDAAQTSGRALGIMVAPEDALADEVIDAN